MKRDIELIKKILLFVENSRKGKPALKFSEMPKEFVGVDETALATHIWLAVNRGLLIASSPDSLDRDFTLELTWAGFDYLDEFRSKNLKE